MKLQGEMYSLHGFLFKIFPLRCTGLHRPRPKAPDTPLSPRSDPSPVPFPGPAAKPRHRAPETKKGGKISPAAKRFPLSPFREAVEPPLFVPVFRDRMLGELCDGQSFRFYPGEDRLDDVRGKAVQGKDAGDVAGFQTELL